MRLHIKSQEFTVRVDPDGDGSDLLTDLLGFTKTQSSPSSSGGGLLTPKVEGWIAQALNTVGFGEKNPPHPWWNARAPRGAELAPDCQVSTSAPRAARPLEP